MVLLCFLVGALNWGIPFLHHNRHSRVGGNNPFSTGQSPDKLPPASQKRSVGEPSLEPLLQESSSFPQLCQGQCCSSGSGSGHLQGHHPRVDWVGRDHRDHLVPASKAAAQIHLQLPLHSKVSPALSDWQEPLWSRDHFLLHYKCSNRSFPPWHAVSYLQTQLHD